MIILEQTINLSITYIMEMVASMLSIKGQVAVKDQDVQLQLLETVGIKQWTKHSMTKLNSWTKQLSDYLRATGPYWCGSNCGVSQLSTILALVDIKYRLSQNQFDNLFPVKYVVIKSSLS